MEAIAVLDQVTQLLGVLRIENLVRLANLVLAFAPKSSKQRTGGKLSGACNSQEGFEMRTYRNGDRQVAIRGSDLKMLVKKGVASIVFGHGVLVDIPL